MGYSLGIDLGTTYTAAAVHADGVAQIQSLGSRTAAIPSVVLLREDETELTGEAAVRRAMTEPERVAREFKRRLGDSTPILVGGSPYSAEALMARLLRSVVDEVKTREGDDLEHLTISHPANWGAYKIDLLRQAIRIAGLPSDAELITEPEAAAISYAEQNRIEPGQIIAVYDLGGGTFDAAVLQKTETGFTILGEPEGIERLGGIDFDAAVFAHVARSVDGALGDLDEDDPAAQNAVARLRADCVEAKEALSSDTDASIPVLLPNLQTEVRITRTEFESMIRPSLVDSIDALRRALTSAGVATEDVHSVLLVGGSSRIPLVAQLVGAELGRPVAVDAHPKHAVALGAAYAAASQGSGGSAAAPPAAAAPAAAAATAQATEPPAEEPAEVPPPPPVAPDPEPEAAPADVAPAAVAAAAAAPPNAPMPTSIADPGPPPTEKSGGSKRGLIIGGIAAAVVAIGVVAALALGGGGDEPITAGSTTVADSSTVATSIATTEAPETTTSVATTTTMPPTTTTVPVCDLDAPDLCIEITSVEIQPDGENLLIVWEAVNFESSINANHGHFFWSSFDVEKVGSQAGADADPWDAIASQPFETSSSSASSIAQRPTNGDQICVTPANGSHAVIDPTIFHCVDVPFDGS